MGYPAVDGVVNTNAPLTAINIPVGAGAGAEGDHDDEHDGESGFGVGHWNAVSGAGDGVRLPGRAARGYGYLRADGSEHMELLGGAAGGGLFEPAAAPAPITGTMTFDANGNLDYSDADGTGAAETVGTTRRWRCLRRLRSNFNPALRRCARRWRGRSEHPMEPAWLQRHAHYQPGGHDIGSFRDHAEWLRQRPVSKLHHRLRWNGDGDLLERAKAKRGATSARRT